MKILIIKPFIKRFQFHNKNIELRSESKDIKTIVLSFF